MSREPLTADEANEIYDVLVERAAVPEEYRGSFVTYQTGNWCEEYRIGGKLGSGGKFRRSWVRQGCISVEIWTVDAYPEDMLDPSVAQRVDLINHDLASLRGRLVSNG